MSQPSETGDNGRLSNGKFGTGNRFAKGNPNARRVAALRQALLASVKPSDLREIVQTLIQRAKEGDLNAAREVLDRVLGRAVAAVAASVDVATTAREPGAADPWAGLPADKIERIHELDELIAGGPRRGEGSRSMLPIGPQRA